MYRPKEGWGNPMPCSECVRVARGTNCASSCHQYMRYSSKEAGADAILTALWKMAKESPTGTFTFDTNTINIFSEGQKED